MFGFKVFIKNEEGSSFIEKYELPTGKVIQMSTDENSMIDLEPIMSFKEHNFERYVNGELVAISVLNCVHTVPVLIENNNGALEESKEEHILSIFYDDIVEN